MSLAGYLQQPGGPGHPDRDDVPPPETIRFKPGESVGEATINVPPGQDPCWDDMLTRMGFGGQIEVLELIEVTAWQGFMKGPDGAPEKVTLHRFRARVVRRRDAETVAEIERLKEDVLRYEPRPVAPARAVSLVANVCDMQAGKPDGDGTEGMVRRFERSIDSLASLIDYVQPEEFVLGFVGDLIENCGGSPHYPAQDHRVQLHRRDQCTLIRRIGYRLLTTLAPRVPRVRVPVVPGNHGENRTGGKSVTCWATDNDDVAIPEQIAELLACNPEAFGHVEFYFPNRASEDLTVSLDVQGVPIGWAHGHQARGGGNPRDRLWRWWERMRTAEHPIGSVRILNTAHYHHAFMRQEGRLTHWGCPPLDGASTYFHQGGGSKTAPGVLTYEVSQDYGPQGWGRPRVLR